MSVPGPVRPNRMTGKQECPRLRRTTANVAWQISFASPPNLIFADIRYGIGRRPRSLAIVSASRNSATSCVVNALVDATPISTPARVKNFSLVARAIALVGTLMMPSVVPMPSDCACFSAASVSAVSPDCEITMTSVRGFGTLSR